MSLFSKLLSRIELFWRCLGKTHGQIEALRARYFLTKNSFCNNVVTVGDWTYVHPSARVYAWRQEEKCRIGKFCSIASQVKIIVGGNHDHKNKVSNYPLQAKFFRSIDLESSTKGPVVIGNDVWIGMNATILSGVNIGDGAVIGAQSVIAKDVPPYAIVVGNPARIVGARFNEEIIGKLMKIRWWDWTDLEIRDRVGDFEVGAVDDFVRKYQII